MGRVFDGVGDNRFFRFKIDPVPGASSPAAPRHHRWRKEYGGLKIAQARRLKELEQENARLKGAVANLTLDKLILKEAAER